MLEQAPARSRRTAGSAPIAPCNTTGATGWFSANSAVGRWTYRGSYNCVMKEIGRPETTDSFTLLQSSPEVLSIIAQPSSVASACGPKINR